MPQTSKLAARRIRLLFTEDGEDYEVSYVPFRQDLIDKMADEDAPTKEQVRGIFNGIKGCVVEWNMLDDDGAMTPITDAGLLTIPADILGLIWTRITEDMSVGKRSGKGSPAPLRRVV